MNYKQLTWDEFEKQFAPVTDTKGNYWLETYGPDLERVKNTNPANVFTIVDGSGLLLNAVSGYHFINRLNYVITTNPVPAGVEYFITNEKGEN